MTSLLLPLAKLLCRARAETIMTSVMRRPRAVRIARRGRRMARRRPSTSEAGSRADRAIIVPGRRGVRAGSFNAPMVVERAARTAEITVAATATATATATTMNALDAVSDGELADPSSDRLGLASAGATRYPTARPMIVA